MVNLFQQIASRTVIHVPSVCAMDEQAGGLTSLWKFGISGDLPIICLFTSRFENIDTVKTVAKAMEYLSLKRIRITSYNVCYTKLLRFRAYNGEFA